MIGDRFKSYLESIIKAKIIDIAPVSGGDISQAYLVKSNQNYFLKCNSSNKGLALFEAEKEGLETIASTHTIQTPKIFNCGQYEDNSYLILEYILPKQPSPSNMVSFAKDLASLHQCTSQDFGFSSNNFIGSLNQCNKKHEKWSTFFTVERLLPQLQLARSNGTIGSEDIPSENALLALCDSLFFDIKPALLHGDLWSGNFLISENDIPYLVDPSVYYGHHEVDLAMSMLFGNFGEAFYSAYHNIIPKSNGFDDRIQIYQLYYLLVHLNLFGSSYYNPVLRILHSYF